MALRQRGADAAGGGGGADRRVVLLVLAAPALGAEDRPAEPRTAAHGRPGPQRRGKGRHRDRARLGRPLPGRRRIQGRPDHRRRQPGGAAALPAPGRRTARRAGGDRARPQSRTGSNRCRNSATRCSPRKATSPLSNSSGASGAQLNVAAGGVAELRDGISEASDGAGLLALGSDHAGEGAELIANGLGRAAAGSGRAIGALEQFATGSRRLEVAIGEAALGALELKNGSEAATGSNLKFNGLKPARKLQQAIEADANKTLPKLLGPAKEADAQLKIALAQLQGMTVGQTDPNYAAALAAVQRAVAAVSGTDPVSGAALRP